MCNRVCTKWYHCIRIRMSHEQYQVFRDDYNRDNALMWLCYRCQDQDKGITQKVTPIAMVHNLHVAFDNEICGCPHVI